MKNVIEYIKEKLSVKDVVREEYEEKIIKHKREMRLKKAGVALVVLTALLVFLIYIGNRTYETYEVMEIIETNNSKEGNYYSFKDGMLVYSDDGISYFKNGEYVWNQAFEMKEPVIDICEDMVAITDLNTNRIYIYDDEEKQAEVETVYPIIKLEVSKQGVVAALTQDAKTNRIEVFDKNNNSIAVGQTYVSGEGCPIDISLSNDGTRLAASYVYIDGKAAKGKVVFYNYSEVGKNEVSRIVGGFNCREDGIAGCIDFVDNETVVAYTNDVVSIYEVKEKPKLVEEIELGADIQSVLYNEEYIGVVILDDDYELPKKLIVYDKSAKVIMKKNFDFDYEDMVITSEAIVLYNKDEMMMWTLSGRQRFYGDIDEGIEKLVVTEEVNRFYIINAEFDIMDVELD